MLPCFTLFLKFSKSSIIWLHLKKIKILVADAKSNVRKTVNIEYLLTCNKKNVLSTLMGYTYFSIQKLLSGDVYFVLSSLIVKSGKFEPPFGNRNA
jgi:hypothetical protein